MSATLVPCHLWFGMPTDQQRQSSVVLHHDLSIGFGSKMRFRFRNEHFAEIFIRSRSGVRRFILEYKDDHWFVDPQWEQGANQTL